MNTLTYNNLKNIIGGGAGGYNALTQEGSYWILTQNKAAGQLISCHKGELVSIGDPSTGFAKQISSGKFVANPDRNAFIVANSNGSPAEVCAAGYLYGVQLHDDQTGPK